MKKFINNKFSKPWYLFAISAYPVLALLAVNEGQVRPESGLRSILASILFGLLLYVLTWLFLRNVHKAALLVTIWLALFFSYGHVYVVLEEKFPDANYTTWFLYLWLILFLAALVFILRTRWNIPSATQVLNVVSLALVVMSSWQIGSAAVDVSKVHTLGADRAPVDNDLVLPDDPPDVYFFLLDSYARADFLETVYGYDNSEFINALEERGFYVAKCSQSNYVRTEISLGSSLNMMYLQDLDDYFAPENISRKKLWDALKHSAVRYNFESLGYETVAFATGFPFIELYDADHFITPPPFTSGFSDFEGMFLRTTLARYTEDWGWVDPDAAMGQDFRARFNTVFDSISDITQMPGPQFSYIHLISPHPPFVFDADGNPNYPPDFWNDKRLYTYDLYEKGYEGQVTHLNEKMLEAIDTILKESTTPPIIVIQGDHGPWMQPKDRRMWILNAYYLPGHEDKLYPAISPVNTFRLIFDSYFGGNYKLLGDTSFYSPVPNLYDFSIVEPTCY